MLCWTSSSQHKHKLREEPTKVVTAERVIGVCRDDLHTRPLAKRHGRAWDTAAVNQPEPAMVGVVPPPLSLSEARTEVVGDSECNTCWHNNE
jgi:hypothetical protein